MKFSEEVARVTGSSTGIGRAVAEALAQQGRRVVVHYNASEDEATKVVEGISSSGGEAMLVGGDVSDSDEVGRMDGEIEARYGRLAVLVDNSAWTKPGRAFPGGPRWFTAAAGVGVAPFTAAALAARSLRLD